MTDNDLIALLRDCHEPILRHNIVDAGLIRAATVTLDSEAPGSGITGVPPRYVAKITLVARGSDEAANARLVAQIENRLLGVQAISRVTVTLLPALFPIL
jgi:metal-sulfur cluster biosynthetic enzyme